ncbi:MAG: cytochrome oxidase subunit III [Candidatus Eisenbacteria bacterium]|uniref:Cytochrome oxidase subunit III n=1 Tax=Eiseniibacteriota bacterium TaxID=2212470 RepID=A0A849SNA3_UNCEI|nr:cytochrome oxidase subunit III [Candidatus Eisenbacteria bacterium]
MNIPTGRLAVWWVLVSEIVIFGGLLASYLMNRLTHADWADQAAHTNTWIGAFNTLVLLTSSLSAVLAHQAAEKGDGPKAARLLWLTVLGGATFLVVKSFEWTHEIREGFTITSSGFWSYYYTAAGLHAFHVLCGMILMIWVASTAAKNQELHRVENIGIYWHFVDIVWIFLFPLLYIAK